MRKISVVIPCYRSQDTIESVVGEVRNTVAIHEQFDYEIVLVNDASPDNVIEVLFKLAHEDPKIKVINLSKNFGQHPAIMSGFNYVTGDLVMCLDDDGQTPATEMFKLIEELDKGFDIVYANYESKEHNIFRNFGTFVNNVMAELLIDKPKNVNMTSYFVTKKFIVDEVIKYQNSFPYIGGLLFRVSNKISKVQVKHRKRLIGKSGYSFKGLVTLWLNGFTAFSVKPLRISSLIGFLLAIAGFIYGIIVIYKRLTNPDIPLGYSSLISAIIFIGGMIMLMLGLIGEYIGRIYITMNKSPQFVIRETVNIDENE
ncbi:MAG TPA: glycosyltransferase [Erysipelotrichaceae bacterium]|nr:glycosyltransferase [Erysipelotrichaceae bacterium]